MAKIKSEWDWDLSCIPHIDLLKQIHLNRIRLNEMAANPPEMDDGEEEEILDVFPYQICYQWREFHEKFPLTENATSMDVLKQILTTGHIRAGWSFRQGRPTIYGPRGACCFTEMPLYALLQYVGTGHSMISNYGIALPKRELFQHGGRSVIYGLSGEHVELPNEPETYAIPTEAWIREKLKDPSWPRILSDSTGLGINEQYRYVATNMDKIDWTHEREWRWPYSMGTSCPGLSLWLKDESPPFSELLIFVPTEAEAAEILDHIKSLYDAEHYNEGDWYYSKLKLTRTRVFSLEKFASNVSGIQLDSIRLEDIPSYSLSTFKSPPHTEETMSRLLICINEARVAAINAATHYEWQYPFGNHSKNEHWCGHALIMLESPQSELVSAFRALEAKQRPYGLATGDFHITPRGQEGYCIHGLIPPNATHTQAIGSHKAAAKAIVEVFKQHFPDSKFSVKEYLT